MWKKENTLGWRMWPWTMELVYLVATLWHEVDTSTSPQSNPTGLIRKERKPITTFGMLLWGRTMWTMWSTRAKLLTSLSGFVDRFISLHDMDVRKRVYGNACHLAYRGTLTFNSDNNGYHYSLGHCRYLQLQKTRRKCITQELQPFSSTHYFWEAMVRFGPFPQFCTTK